MVLKVVIKILCCRALRIRSAFYLVSCFRVFAVFRGKTIYIVIHPFRSFEKVHSNPTRLLLITELTHKNTIAVEMLGFDFKS